MTLKIGLKATKTGRIVSGKADEPISLIDVIYGKSSCTI